MSRARQNTSTLRDLATAHRPGDRPTAMANDAERETQVTEIITRLERVLAEAAKLREELERLNGTPLSASVEGD